MKSQLSILSLGLLAFTACAGPEVGAPGSEPGESEAPQDVETRTDPLVQSCTTRSGTFALRTPSFSVSADVVGVGDSNPPPAVGESTLVIPAGNTNTTVTMTPQLEAGIGLIGSPPSTWLEASSTLALDILDSSGANICHNQVDILRRSGAPLTASLPDPTALPISCRFDHASSGQTVTARLTMSAFARVAPLPPFPLPGEAHARARLTWRGTMPTVSQSNCSPRIAWCVHAGARLISLDANGDGKTDHLCHTSSTSHLMVNVTPSSGVPDDVTDFDVLGFCGGSDTLVTGDVNRDGRDDLICVNPFTHRVRVSFARVTRPGTADRVYNGVVDRDTTVAGRQCHRPRVADFNGDGADDLLCDTSIVPGGTVEKSFSDGNGNFFSATATGLPGCSNPRNANGYLAGDVDGDGQADIICNRASSTEIRLGMASRPASAGVFCTHTDSRLTLANADGGAAQELVCLTRGSGYIHVLGRTGPDAFDAIFARGSDARFCPGGDPVTAVDYAGTGRSGLTCQVPAAPSGSPLGTISVLPRLL